MLRLPACLSSHTRNFLTIILTIAASLTASAGVLYYTSFEKTDTPPFTAGVGTAASPKLVGTDNWTMVASPNGLGIATYYPFAGIDSSLVPELDQTAALGCLDHVNFTMPPSGTQYIRVARKVDAQPSGMPVIDFYCQIGLAQSTNGHSDDFELLVYNWDEKVLGGLTFDLSRNKLYRYDANEFNDLTNDPYTDTGLSLSTLYGKVLEVTMRINYQTNTWTATVGGVQVVSGATFTMRSTTTGNSPAARTFGSLSARWYINATTTPGNNWILINDWTITNSTPTIPATTSASYAANSTATIAVTDTGSAGWSMSSDQTWALVSPSSGSGSATVTVTCAANPNTTARTATLTMGSQTCILTQAAAPAVTSIPATASAAYPANSTASLTVTSNTTWNTSSNQLWAVVSPASGSGNGTVTVTCAANPNTTARTATLTVGTQTCILTQAAAPAVTSIPATASAAYPANS
ncbi:MAG: BACON domain-containing protein, partial [Verrucomicrobiota bacterium]